MINKRLCLLGAAMVLSGAMLPAAHAQVALPPTPTGFPARGVSMVPAPPLGLNPVTASPTVRAQFSIPPAPDKKVAPEAYNLWRTAVSGIHNQVYMPVLTPTHIVNGRVLNNKNGQVSNGVAHPTSSNWSGPVITQSGNPFAVEAIIGVFVVPTARQAFGSCTGGWDRSSMWPGIDGYGSNDVLQAGVEVDAYCNGSTTSSLYSAWIEWYPFNETRVSSPAIHPGDLVFVEVWNVSPTAGRAYFYNYSTQTAAAYQLTAPSGTTLVGNSIEWIAERPGVNGGLATLTNYVDTSWTHNYAWNYATKAQTYYFPGTALSEPEPYTLSLVTMIDNVGKGISYCAPQNFGFLYCQDYGSANGGNVAGYD